jgi:hypothetical protein
MRIHVRHLTVKTAEPDKKGTRSVVFVGLTRYEKQVQVDEAQWQALQPLLASLRAAGAAFEQP